MILHHLPDEFKEVVERARVAVDVEKISLPARYGTAFHVRTPVEKAYELTGLFDQKGAHDFNDWEFLNEIDRGRILSVIDDDPYLLWQVARAEQLSAKVLVVPEGSYMNISREVMGSDLCFVVVSEGARLTVDDVILNDAVAVRRLFVWQKEDSVFSFTGLRSGEMFLSERLQVFLEGARARTEITHLCVGGGKSQLDIDVTTWHRGVNTKSDMGLRMSGGDKFSGVYKGCIDVDEKALGSQGYQSGKTLALSRRAVMDILPKLNIRTNQVKCSHGVTSSHVDDEALFYLRSRGLSLEVARELVIRSFFEADMTLSPALLSALDKALL